jgi:hypothetical protein
MLKVNHLQILITVLSISNKAKFSFKNYRIYSQFHFNLFVWIRIIVKKIFYRIASVRRKVKSIEINFINELFCIESEYGIGLALSLVVLAVNPSAIIFSELVNTIMKMKMLPTYIRNEQMMNKNSWYMILFLYHFSCIDR